MQLFAFRCCDYWRQSINLLLDDLLQNINTLVQLGSVSSPCNNSSPKLFALFAGPAGIAACFAQGVFQVGQAVF
jgi:hypothetical protein